MYFQQAGKHSLSYNTLGITYITVLWGVEVFVDVITHAAMRNDAYEYFSNYQTQLFGKSLFPEYELSAHGWMGMIEVKG